MALLRVEVVYALADRVQRTALELPAGATVADALRASGVADKAGAIGIFCKRVDPGTRLADSDRVGIYRALRLDPKDARRRRALRKR